MKTRFNFSPRRRRLAFTLIELLVVIAIIGVLAALLFPAGKAIKEKATRNKARTQLKMVAAAIDSYKSKFGYYPPDHVLNPPGVDPLRNSLYFELSGATNDTANAWFQTLDGAARVSTTGPNGVQATFGQGAILNCSKGSGDDGQPAVTFLKEVKPGQYAELLPNVRILTCSVKWPTQNGEVLAGLPEVNPWRYVVTGATNSPGEYDLWVDIVLGGKTNRISNWSETYEIVP